jgi:undecaprenyl-diphosphatase
VLALVLGAATGRTGEGLGVVALVWVTLGLNYSVKRIVRRPRPPLDAPLPPLIRAPATPSFPSSHAAMAAAAAFGLSALEPAFTPLFATLAVLMAASRVYLAVHHAADVLAGVLLGCVAGAVYLLVV